MRGHVGAANSVKCEDTEEERMDIRVYKLALGTLDLNFLADRKKRKVSGDVAFLVSLLSLSVACIVTVFDVLTNLDN